MSKTKTGLPRKRLCRCGETYVAPGEECLRSRCGAIMPRIQEVTYKNKVDGDHQLAQVTASSP